MSEPHHQHQNFAENRIGTLKDWTNRLMDRVGAPDNTWLLCMEYVSHLLNHLAHKSLNIQVPLTKMFGVTVDISAFLNFTFWQPVYYAAENKWPSESAEKSGRWVGIAPNVGDALTYTILTDDTNKLIFRSAVRARDGKTNENKRLDTFKGDEATKPIRNVITSPENAAPNVHAPNFSPDDLLGRTFLQQPTESGERFRATIVRKIIEMEGQEEKIKFLLKLPDQAQDEIIKYNDLVNLLSDQYDAELQDTDRQWLFKAILAHKGPLSKKHPRYNSSICNVLVQWEDGSTTHEPLDKFRDRKSVV